MFLLKLMIVPTLLLGAVEDGAMDDTTLEQLQAAAERAADADDNERAAEFLRRAWMAVHPDGAHPDKDRFQPIDKLLAKTDRNHKNAVSAREKAFDALFKLAAAEEKDGHYRTAQTLIQDMEWLCSWRAAGEVARLETMIQERKAEPDGKKADLDDLKRSGLYSINRLQRILEDETQIKKQSKEDALFRDWMKARSSAAKSLAKAGGNYAKAKWFDSAVAFLQQAHDLDAERNEKALNKARDDHEKALDSRAEESVKKWFASGESLLDAGTWRTGGGQIASPDLKGKAGLFLTGEKAEGTYECSVWFHTGGGEEALPALVFAYQDDKNHGMLRPRLGKSRIPGQSTMVYLDVVQVTDGQEKVLETKAAGANFNKENWNPLKLRVLGNEVAAAIGQSPELKVKFEGAQTAAPLGLFCPGVEAKEAIHFGRWSVREIVP